MRAAFQAATADTAARIAALEARHRWFDAVLQAECGELEGGDDKITCAGTIDAYVRGVS